MVIISIAYVLKISLISSFRNCMLLLGKVVSCLFDRVYSLGVTFPWTIAGPTAQTPFAQDSDLIYSHKAVSLFNP